MARGTVVDLSREQIVSRLLYLGGVLPLGELDDFIDKDPERLLALGGYSEPDAAVGHIGGIVSVPAEWDPDVRDCWELLGVVDVSAVDSGRANTRRTARGWFGTGALFVVSTMTP